MLTSIDQGVSFFIEYPLQDTSPYGDSVILSHALWLPSMAALAKCNSSFEVVATVSLPIDVKGSSQKRAIDGLASPSHYQVLSTCSAL